MLTKSSLDHLVVFVHDLEASRVFYEQRLGLPVVDVDYDSVKLDAGCIGLWLARAQDRGVPLTGRRDDSSDVVFLVDDLEATRLELEDRGVEFVRRRTYEVGLVTDFYDPNGHRLMLYQPSAEALTWPSANKIREVWRSSGRGDSTLIGPAAGLPQPGAGLAGKPLIYLFMFENDASSAFDFYHGLLGLEALERVHCCNQSCSEEVEGIVKYESGGVLLSTHHVHESSVVTDDAGRVYSPREYDREHAKGIAPVFSVLDVGATVAELSGRGVRFPYGIEEAPYGAQAWFEDPFGHPFFVKELSTGVLAREAQP